MITNNEQILNEMKMIYSWTDGTLKTYRTALKDYTEYHQMTIQELILEAENDEETINKLSKRKLKQRLLQYRLYIQEEKNFSENTVRMYLAIICKIYKYHDISIPYIPGVKVVQTETFKDIPTYEEIQKAILHSRTKMKAIISFIASTGLRRSDVANLTIEDFIVATMDYHNDPNDLLEFINQLSKKDFIIPTWNVVDIKTGINHISFSSHESSVYILQMLQERLMKEDLGYGDKLFGVKPDSISKNFRNLNTKLGMGWKKHRRHFHPHALRKYFATTLTANDMDLLSSEFLLGHTLKGSQRSYYFANPEKLFNKYVRIVDNLTFTMNVSVVDVTSREKRELNELRAFKKESDERIRKLEELINLIPNR